MHAPLVASKPHHVSCCDNQYRFPATKICFKYNPIKHTIFKNEMTAPMMRHIVYNFEIIANLKSGKNMTIRLLGNGFKLREDNFYNVINQ